MKSLNVEVPNYVWELRLLKHFKSSYVRPLSSAPVLKLGLFALALKPFLLFALQSNAVGEQAGACPTAYISVGQ